MNERCTPPRGKVIVVIGTLFDKRASSLAYTLILVFDKQSQLLRRIFNFHEKEREVFFVCLRVVFANDSNMILFFFALSATTHVNKKIFTGYIGEFHPNFEQC